MLAPQVEHGCGPSLPLILDNVDREGDVLFHPPPPFTDLEFPSPMEFRLWAMVNDSVVRP
jgi:hypothetical protein